MFEEAGWKWNSRCIYSKGSCKCWLDWDVNTGLLD
jgi:hypothetical protein